MAAAGRPAASGRGESTPSFPLDAGRRRSLVLASLARRAPHLPNTALKRSSWSPDSWVSISPERTGIGPVQECRSRRLCFFSNLIQTVLCFGKRISTTALSAVFLVVSSPFAVAQNDNSPIIGASPFHRAPSLDTTIQKLRVGQETYGIPRNYIFAIEEHPPGMAAAVSMRGMLPDMSPMIHATRPCFIDVRVPCNSEIVTFGLTRDRWPMTATTQLKNSKNLLKPEKKIGPCGLEYFEDKAPTERTGQGFNWFIRNADLPLLRCPKENATAYRPLCSSRENLDDTNSFYYSFNRTKLCEWSEISQKIIGLFRNFREQGARQ